MTKANIIAVAVTIVATLAVSVATAIVGFMVWALALNGFMGREFVVNASMFTYLGLAVIICLLSVGLAGLATHRLAVRRGWNSAGAAALSVTAFTVFVCAAHLVCVIISAIVASVLWKTG